MPEKILRNILSELCTLTCNLPIKYHKDYTLLSLINQIQPFIDKLRNLILCTRRSWTQQLPLVLFRILCSYTSTLPYSVCKQWEKWIDVSSSKILLYRKVEFESILTVKGLDYFSMPPNIPCRFGVQHYSGICYKITEPTPPHQIVVDLYTIIPPPKIPTMFGSQHVVARWQNYIMFMSEPKTNLYQYDLLTQRLEKLSLIGPYFGFFDFNDHFICLLHKYVGVIEIYRRPFFKRPWKTFQTKTKFLYCANIILEKDYLFIGGKYFQEDKYEWEIWHFL